MKECMITYVIHYLVCSSKIGFPTLRATSTMRSTKYKGQIIGIIPSTPKVSTSKISTHSSTKLKDMSILMMMLMLIAVCPKY